MLPGMERKLTEHMMVHHYTATASEASGRSLQEVPLLKGSFGHHSSSIGGVASSSQESLYGGGVGGPDPPVRGVSWDETVKVKERPQSSVETREETDKLREMISIRRGSTQLETAGRPLAVCPCWRSIGRVSPPRRPGV